VNIFAIQKANNETNEDFAEKLMNENLQQLLNEGNYSIHWQVVRLSTIQIQFKRDNY
jgi:methionine-rich copper-binding protein CopC